MDKCDNLIPNWLNFMKGIVDSENIPLTVSREMLQHNSTIKTLSKVIVKKSINMLESLSKDETKFKNFYLNYSKNIKMGDDIRVKSIDGKNKTINATKIAFPFLTLDKVSLTASEFESKIDLGDKPPLRLGVGKDEVKKTGDVLKDFMNDSKKQSELDKSSQDFLDESRDAETFKNCD